MNHGFYSLFSLEEIFMRLGEGKATGWLHIYTQDHTADLYVEQGEVKAVREKTSLLAEEALAAILKWRTAQTVWLEGRTPPDSVPLAQPKIPLLHFLLKHSIAVDTAKTLPPSSIGNKEPPTGLRPIEKNPLSAELLAETSKVNLFPSLYTAALPRLPHETGANGSSDPQEAKTMTLPRILGPAPSRELAPTSATSATTSDTPKLAPSATCLYTLVWEQDENGSELLPLEKMSNIVGRHIGCDVVIGHPSISRRHCLLQVTEEGVQVRDLGSTNGTKVEGTSDGLAKDGDTLTIGFVPVKLKKMG